MSLSSEKPFQSFYINIDSSQRYKNYGINPNMVIIILSSHTEQNYIYIKYIDIYVLIYAFSINTLCIQSWLVNPLRRYLST